jgi:antitoxin HicB
MMSNNRPETQNLGYYLGLPYSILLVPDEDGWYAEIPELPGCMTCGETKEDALQLIEDAKISWLKVSLANGDSIPEPEHARSP